MPSTVEDILATFAQELQLSTDSEPMVVLKKGLTLKTVQVTAADLIPCNAVEIDTVGGISTLAPGDHIMLREENRTTGHQGIFVGEIDGRTSVVDMLGANKASAKIAIRPLSAFLKSKPQLLIIKYRSDSAEFRSLTKQLALAFAAEADSELLYNALSNNCEYFATFCRIFRYDIPSDMRRAAILAAAKSLKHRPTIRKFFIRNSRY